LWRSRHGLGCGTRAAVRSYIVDCNFPDQSQSQNCSDPEPWASKRGQSFSTFGTKCVALRNLDLAVSANHSQILRQVDIWDRSNSDQFDDFSKRLTDQKLWPAGDGCGYKARRQHEAFQLLSWTG